MTALWVGLAIFIALVPLSFVVEAWRRKPAPPDTLAWDRAIPLSYITINGVRIRYLRAGGGPPLVVLHTLRTQLDIFQKVIPDLAKSFTVYAMDYPGHGWSDIPKADYTPAFFTRVVTDFLDALKIERALVAGVSIGASIPLLMAAQQNPRVRAVVSVNPYDYGKRGIERANWVAKILFTLAAIPVLGDTVMRLRNPLVEGKVLDGGVATPSALPAAFRTEVYRVGERPGHYQAFLNLIRHMPLWRETHEAYSQIRVPVLLVYGDRDWSREADRQRTGREIPGARLETVANAGHFLPMDQPAAFIQHVTDFARELELVPRSPSSGSAF